jgi:hypothetical protein
MQQTPPPPLHRTANVVPEQRNRTRAQLLAATPCPDCHATGGHAAWCRDRFDDYEG